jgi:protein-disulfide isomerase
MKNFSIILSTVAIILAAVAVYSTCKCKATGPEAAAGAVTQEQLAAVLTQNPKLVADALQAYEQIQREEAERARNEALLAHAGDINSEADVPFVGPKDAKVTVVEFFDFTCGYCKRLSSSIEKVVADNADVKFVFKPLTFVSPISKYQAQAGMAAHKQGKFMEFYKEVMSFSGLMKEADVDGVAAKIGLDMDKYKADLNSDAVKSSLEKVSSLAQAIQVNGVPTVFVNAKHIQAMSPEPIQDAINAAK